MKIHTFFLLIFFLLFFCTRETYTQNSLYLVDTLTGTATNNKLWKAEGVGDFNGDNLADFIVCYDQYVDLYFGNTQFKPQFAHRFSLPPKDNYFKGSAYGIGDVNGDGYADLMIITGDTSYYPIYSYGEIVFGGKELDTIPKFKYYPPYYWKMLMSDAMYPLGDLNGDGYNDFAISSPMNWDDGLGRVYIFKGGKTLVDTPWVVLKGLKGIEDGFYGYSSLGIGDQNNDSLDDFLISTIDSMKVYLYLGNKDSISVLPLITYGPYTYISEVKSAGNLTGNGRKDFIITADGNAYIFLGYNNSVIYDASKLDIGGYIAIGTYGDINGDGYDDFLIGNTNYRNADSVMVGGVVGFWGGGSINLNDEAFRVEGDKKWFEYGKAINIVGDINGDGFDDVFVLQPSYPDFNNPTGKLFIYSYTKITGINNRDLNSPTTFILNQNYPNPFNPTTIINFSIPQSGQVSLKVYDLLGREVATLVNEELNAGAYSTKFDAENLSSGVYVYRLTAKNFTSNKKMMLMK